MEPIGGAVQGVDDPFDGSSLIGSRCRGATLFGQNGVVREPFQDCLYDYPLSFDVYFRHKVGASFLSPFRGNEPSFIR